MADCIDDHLDEHEEKELDELSFDEVFPEQGISVMTFFNKLEADSRFDDLDVDELLEKARAMAEEAKAERKRGK